MTAIRKTHLLSASDRYEKAFEDYKAKLESNPKISFVSYCTSHHIYKPGFNEWIAEHGYSIYELRYNAKMKANREKQAEVSYEKNLEPNTSPLVPLGFIQFKPSYKRTATNLLNNVCIKLPNDISITIQSASVEEIIDIINRCNYKLSQEA